jgi:flavin reductase (DIM6/NTAB) family NADH-FMN oxidoreductase RutF
MKKIPLEDLLVRPFHLLDQEWALLVAGTGDDANPMTVSWGGFGTLWHRPVATVYVRPQRHTFALLEQHPEFTLSVLPAARRSALELCGTRSGRDIDKWREARLDPRKSSTVAVPHVGGAELVLECRVLATLDVDPRRFVDLTVEECYPERDYHRVYLGQTVAAWGGDRFRAG